MIDAPQGSTRLVISGWLRARPEIAIVAGLLGFVALTNRWMSWGAGYRLLMASDEADYRAIALAAPKLPSVRIAEQHAQRWPLHYVIGSLASATGLSVEVVYGLCMGLLAVVLCVVLARVLVELGVNTTVFALCMAVFILNTYSLRYYGLAPGELADLLFQFGVLAAVLGLLRRHGIVVLVGVAVATLARQSAVPVALAVAAWIAFGPRWRGAPVAARLTRALAVGLLCGGVYATLVAVAAPFSLSTTPDFAHLTLLSDLERLPAGLGQLGQHFGRTVNGLLTVCALLGTVLVARTRAKLPFEFWACLLIAFSIVAQPAVFSAEYAAHNETRLAVLGLGAFVCALAIAFRESDAVLTTPACAVLIGVLAVGSFHHLYTVIGTAKAGQTVVLQAVTALVAGALLWRSMRVSAHPSPARERPG